ncbi:synaptic vesicular amine transporter-like [Uloborus diversus]|uniref:synaptic vesicular amine transporter-like n=1 Tax=Uloborus diversus TaxID=327109 RepID=UPI00240A8178|nr:synaptic vesicular amine transporter-like [Uloborus diversus]
MTQDMTSTNCILDLMQRFRGSRKLVLLIVAIALLLDNMLLSSVVPIIPAYLYELHHEQDLKRLNLTDTTAPATTPDLREICDRLRDQDNAESDNGKRRKQRNKGRKNAVYSTTEVSETTTEPPITTLSPEMKELRHSELVNENVEVGIMFASKPIVQAVTNPFIGPLTNRIGYSIPMFSGFVIMFLSTLIFAMGTNYAILFIARSLQGVGSACTSVAGMGMLAAFYPDDRERGNAMAIALGGLALGVMIGPPFGGIMYEFVGRAAPFLILAFISLFDGILQLMVLQPKVTKEEQEGASIFTLIRDPYILIAAGAITFANMGIATLEPSLPLWMMDTMNAPKWQQGAAFLPASISYLIGTNLFGPLGHRMGRWLSTMVGLLIIGVCLLLIPMARNITHLIVPNAGIGFAIGMVDSSMMPMLGYLVDIRHTSIYGSVYAIGDVAFCVGFAVGPMLSGSIVKAIGFTGLVYCIAVVCFLYAPLMFLLRKPPGRAEDQVLLKDTAIRYVSYTNDESPDEEDFRKPQPQQQEWVK